LFQILRKIKFLKFLNEKQVSMIQQKLLKQNLEIEEHEKDLQDFKI